MKDIDHLELATGLKMRLRSNKPRVQLKRPEGPDDAVTSE
jgi:hypothetical protein